MKRPRAASRPAGFRTAGPLAFAAALVGAAAVAAAVALTAPRAFGQDDALTRTLRRVLTAREATATVVLERSDPFGGPPERERGRVWYIPGRGLRYRVDGSRGLQLALDRAADRMILYRPAEPRVYRTPWAKAPSKLRRLVAEPERVLRGASGATSESRRVHGAARPGWKLRPASLGDSDARVSLWVSLDPKSGLPRFVSLGSDADTLLVEFRSWSFPKARPGDLEVRVPRGTPEAPLDPRELLDPREGGERERR
jgi:hypothetical protein